MIELNQAEHEHRTLESGATNGHQPRPWRAYGLISKLVILVLLTLSAASFLLPFADRALLTRLGALPNGRQLVDWMVNQSGSWILGAGLLGLLLAFVLIKRFQTVRDQQLWYDTGCPQCFERELVRVPRKRSDRWYALVMLPAFRYACRNCTWQGLRIARRYNRPEPLTLAEALAEAGVGVAADYRVSAAQTGGDGGLSPAAVLPDLFPATMTEHKNGDRPEDVTDEVEERVEMTDAPIAYDDMASGDTETVEADEDWEPFADDELDDGSSFIERVPATQPVDRRQLNAKQSDQPTNHKVREPDDEFDWLWRRLGQNE